jgi:hypothetical protein
MTDSSVRISLDTLAWLIEEAFQGDPSHSLLANLQGLREEDWTARPPGGNRSIAEILEHVGWSKWMYEAGEINHLRALLQDTDRWPY